MVKCLYRISDGSYKKERFEFATKENCLENFLDKFDDVTIFADNVKDTTHGWLLGYGHDVIRTNSDGNGYGFNIVFDWALENVEGYVYFVEDDYIHRTGSQKILLEGLKRSHYVSLYDHIDKYIPKSRGGNPFIGEDGAETTKVLLTDSVHWKMTNSTTMTFASHVDILREDKEVWKHFTNHSHPNDFGAFLQLRNLRGRTLITPIPGYSTHGEKAWAAPLIDWENEI